MLTLINNYDEISSPSAEDIDAMDGERLRMFTRSHSTMNSTSYASIAKAAEIGESTFAAWINGKYKGNNENVEEKIRIWARSQKSFARQKTSLPVETGFVLTRTARKFLAAFEHAQAMPDLAVIIGGAGVGKTSACHQYKTTHPNVWHLTAEPLVASSYAVMAYLRETLGLPEMPAYRLTRAITAKVMNTQGLIIVDEAQHLTTPALDQLRTIHDKAGVGLVFMGNEEVWRRIDGGGRRAQFAQLHSRVGMRVNAPRPLAKDIEEILDASEISDAKQRAVLKTIAGKPGALRALAKTLRVARMVALGAGESMTDEHITSAWNRLSGDTDAAA